MAWVGIYKPVREVVDLSEPRAALQGTESRKRNPYILAKTSHLDNMKASIAIAHLMAAMAAAGAIPREVTTVADPDEAVVYPANVDQSWVDARSVSPDPDEAVVYPASVDQSWVDADSN
ncbi:hypothetical protein GGR58DRAFT_507414 [Xylaria digitata]|nr:hypothetical protein GGR58DRAFT_507414 [Xylaria digitata]